MASTMKTSPSRKSDKKMRSLGMGIEIWVIIFAVIASIPLLNMFALPAIVLTFSAGVAIYYLWRSKI